MSYKQNVLKKGIVFFFHSRMIFVVLVQFVMCGCATHFDKSPGAQLDLRKKILGLESKSPDWVLAEIANKLSKDPSFHCREPIFYDYLKTYDSTLDTQLRTKCPDSIPLRVVSSQKSSIEYVSLNKIRKIHLLFMGPGSGAMSEFGHVALRMIICPNETASDDECDSNLHDHLVFQFAAFVPFFHIDPLEGLVGSYETRFYVSNFMDVYKEYAIDEFRNIYSIPLNLSNKSIKEVAYKLAEIHWRHKSNYYYLSNNCSTLLQDTLSIVLPTYSNNVISDDTFIRPDSFFNRMKETDLVDKEVLSSLSDAESMGYYFPSTEAAYISALSYIKDTKRSFDLEEASSSIDEYLEKDTDLKIAEIEGHTPYLKRIKEDERFYQALVILEELKLFRIRGVINSQISDIIWDMRDYYSTLVDGKNPVSDTNELACSINALRGVITPIAVAESIPFDHPVLPAHSSCKDNYSKESIDQVVFAISKKVPAYDKLQIEENLNEMKRSIDFIKTIDSAIKNTKIN